MKDKNLEKFFANIDAEYAEQIKNELCGIFYNITGPDGNYHFYEYAEVGEYIRVCGRLFTFDNITFPVTISAEIKPKYEGYTQRPKITIQYQKVFLTKIEINIDN